MSSRVYFHSLYKTRDYSYSSSLESPTFHFGFKGVDYRTLTFFYTALKLCRESDYVVKV